MSKNINLRKDYVYHGAFGFLKVKYHITAWTITIDVIDDSEFPIEKITGYEYFYHHIIDGRTVSYYQNVYAKDLAEQMVKEVIRYDKLAVFK